MKVTGYLLLVLNQQMFPITQTLGQISQGWKFVELLEQSTTVH